LCRFARWRTDAVAIIVQHQKTTNRGEAMTAARGDDRLKGKVAIVTGAGSRAEGIGNGRATAVILARHGARVTLVDTVAQWADETKRLIDAEGGVSQIVEGDVGVPASCQAIVARTVEAWGRLDILVNNVGITGPRGNAVEVDVEAWDSAMRVNVASMMLMAKYAIPEMIRSGGGSIINLSSVAGLSGGHPSLLYPTSKGRHCELDARDGGASRP
jgi:NAD(P)-dependent dehydrogenase (short-subunit alcohol dehydrogenase family)